MLESSRTEFKRDSIREPETEKYGLSNPTSAFPRDVTKAHCHDAHDMLERIMQ